MLFSYVLSTSERLNKLVCKKQVNWSIRLCKILFTVEHTRMKQDLEITLKLLLTFKACHSQKKSSVHFISYMYFQMLGFALISLMEVHHHG